MGYVEETQEALNYLNETTKGVVVVLVIGALQQWYVTADGRNFLLVKKNLQKFPPKEFKNSALAIEHYRHYGLRDAGILRLDFYRKGERMKLFVDRPAATISRKVRVRLGETRQVPLEACSVNEITEKLQNMASRTLQPGMHIFSFWWAINDRAIDYSGALYVDPLQHATVARLESREARKSPEIEHYLQMETARCF